MMRTASPLRAGPIRGDELEHNRIQLEHNLQHTDLSLHLSSQQDSEQEQETRHNYDSSVEYPRHNPGPAAERSFNAFASFEVDNFGGDMDSHSQLHAWSYRTADDDEYGGAVNPYGAESMSTAAHHASALTLSAGLRGHGGGRREISLSGAEYDPDRPLGDMIAGVDSRFSMYDGSTSKSKYQATSGVAFDPLVVDDTAELDRVLQSGHAAAASSLAARLRSTAESSSGSDSDSSTRSNRPKLSDALHGVSTFSPKRPRNSPVQHTKSNEARQNRGSGPSLNSYQRTHSSSPRGVTFDPSGEHDNENDLPTPKPRSKRNPAPQPEVTVQPPTPSSAGSRFTKMARGLAKDIEAEQKSIWSEGIRSGAGADPLAQSTMRDHKAKPRGTAVTTDRNPFSDIGNALNTGARMNVKERRSTPRTSKVHLPDVTGLTSAVASPAKTGLDHYGYEGDEEPREAEARFLSVLSAVQSKLAHLESENSISRRRVRELERELDACKAEVARERTRVLERESIIVQQREDVEAAVKASRKEKGKAKSTRFENDGELEERYKEVVEEKKALEALITTLRTHLARLTSELSSHQQLLAELRSLRETDARTLREKSAEVERLREEVERLAGEVEVLKEVVEDGLNERRSVREASTQIDQQDIDRDDTEQLLQETKDDEATPLVTGRINIDRTMRTDHATLGSSDNAGTSSRRFIDGEELDRISLELEERRSDRSGGSVSLSRRDISDHGDHSRHEDRAPSPQISRMSSQGRQATAPVHQEPPSTPFPQIRGGHLEKLFFSAPEHNAKTCTVCHRRSRRANSSSWLPKRKAHDMRGRAEDEQNEDEGFVEGPDSSRDAKNKGKQREHVTFSQEPKSWKKNGEREALPAQTVLARVLRELEDDFTHYKSIYVELAEQYGLMDASSNVTKRNILADHLREVVDILEQKGDQIASLYDLLSFKDKPTSESIVPETRRTRSTPASETSSWGRNRSLKRYGTYA